MNNDDHIADTSYEALAMLRIFLYGDLIHWLPPSVIEELGGHGDEAVVAATNAVVEVLFDELVIENQEAVDAFVERWSGKGASKSDATWLGEAWHVGFVETAITFDLRLVRGVNGEVEGLRVMTPRQYWHELDVPSGAQPRVVPAFGHPLYGIESWRV